VKPIFGDGMVGTISVGFGVTNVISSVVLGRLTDWCGWTLPLGIGILAQVKHGCVLLVLDKSLRVCHCIHVLPRRVVVLHARARRVPMRMEW
jgi:uncharacterized integral membrane protein